MIPFTEQFPSEYLLWFWRWITCNLPVDICDTYPAAMPVAVTNADIATTLILSLSGLLFWLWALMRLLWFTFRVLFVEQRHPTLEELLIEFKQAQDTAQREYLHKLLEQSMRH